MSEESRLGSPNIFLKKNFERGHIFKGVYLINDSLENNFEAYMPVNHLRISYKLQEQIVDGLLTLAHLDSIENDEAQEFVSWLWEHRDIKDCQEAVSLEKKLKVQWKYGAAVIFISVENVMLLKKFLKGYLELYKWSMRDKYDRYTRKPYYSSFCYNNLIYFVRNIDIWLSIENQF